jgi:hypothetical protein
MLALTPTLPVNWIVLQLREGIGLSLPVKDLERELQLRWPDKQLKFPATKQGYLDLENPLSTYVFIEPPVEVNLATRLVACILRDPTTHAPVVLTDDDLAAMRPLPPFPPVGSTVLVTAGDYQGLEGVVVQVGKKTCKVLVELWSKKSVLTLFANELQRL